MEAKRQDIGMDIDENKKDTQNKTNTQDKADTSNKKDKPDGSEKEEAQKSTSASREILSWVLTFALAIGAAFLITDVRSRQRRAGQCQCAAQHPQPAGGPCGELDPPV